MPRKRPSARRSSPADAVEGFHMEVVIENGIDDGSRFALCRARRRTVRALLQPRHYLSRPEISFPRRRMGEARRSGELAPERGVGWFG